MARPYLTPEADADLREISKYISEYDPKAARRVIRKIRSIALMLGRQPLIGDIRDDIRPGLLSFCSGNYVIYYKPTRPRITIVRILHGARDQEGLV